MPKPRSSPPSLRYGLLGSGREHGTMRRERFDLENRLIEFAVMTCRVADQLSKTPVRRHLAVQLIRCATSPAANYVEAQGAESRRDFVHKLKICLKERCETQTWLKFVRRMRLVAEGVGAPVLQECKELLAILAMSVWTAGKEQGQVRTTAECRMSNVEVPIRT